MIRIGKQIDRKTKLVAEGFVRIDIIRTDTNDRDIRLIKIGLGSRERFSLDRTTRCIVLGIDINDQPFAGVIIQA